MVRKLEIHLRKKPAKGERVVSCRLQDRRLWEKIEQRGLHKAAYCLTRGFAYICWGGRVRALSLSEVRGCYQGPYADADDDTLDFLFRCKRDYLEWSNLCERYNTNRHAVMDVLYFGGNLGDVDKHYGRRHGWAAQNILESLALYRK